MTAKMKGEYRENQYDLLRILSCMAVVLIHANWYYFGSKYYAPDGSPEWAVEAIINIFTRFSVPCFAMISGAFNLKREVSAIEYYKRTSFRIFLPTSIIIAIFAFYQVCTNIAWKRSPFYELGGILTGGFYSFWFVYMLAILYLLTPAIIIIKNRCTWNQYKLIALIWAVWAVASQATSSQRLAWSIGVGIAYVSYYLLGDVLSTELKKRKPKRVLLILVSIGCLAFAYFWRKNGHYYYVENAYTNFFSPIVMIYSICVFISIGSLNISSNFSRVSGRTFYLYLFHPLVLSILEKLIGYRLPDIPGIAALALATIFISYLLSMAFDCAWKKMVKKVNLKSKWDGMRIWRLLGY